MGGGAILYAVLYCFSLSANSGHTQATAKKKTFELLDSLEHTRTVTRGSHVTPSEECEVFTSFPLLRSEIKTTHTPAKPDRLRIDGTLVVGSLGSVVL